MVGKTQLIDYAFQYHQIKSFVDLGAVWGVEAGYTFYALDNYKDSEACIVDLCITDTVKEKQKEYLNLRLLNANFGDPGILKQVGNVDAVFLFDILLHQVSPSWTEIIKMYAEIANCFLIFNQQFIGEKTVRLLDLGEEEYFRNVPHSKEHPTYKTLFEQMYEIYPGQQFIYRDDPTVWQWGITNRDLIKEMNNHGFQESYHINYGKFGRLDNFENQAFLFKKK